MITVTDPLGTPTLVFNRGGKAIVTVAPGVVAGSTQDTALGNNATPIPRVCGHMIVLTTTTKPSGDTWHTSLLLPDSAEVGDLVEVYALAGSVEAGPQVFPPIGESIASNPVSTGTNFAAAWGCSLTVGTSFMKVSTSLWLVVSSFPA